jgi:hypothetical protein
MPYWGTRWRRGIITKNYHWRTSMYERYFNALCGKGFGTTAELARLRDTAPDGCEEKDSDIQDTMNIPWIKIFIVIGVCVVIFYVLENYILPLIVVIALVALFLRR